MKRKRHPTFPRLGLIALGLTLLSRGAQAAPFLYTSGDLLLAFRQTGNNADYVVNLGPASAYSELAANSTLVISNVVPSQLTAAFPSVNSLNWSAAAAVRALSDPKFPVQTLWVTTPRSSATEQGAPWLRKGVYTQGTAASQIDAIGNNAAASSSSQPAGPNNTASAVIIPVNTDYAITPLLGESGNFVNTFQGNVETTTPLDFDGQTNNVSRADLYELIPGSSAAGTLNTSGRYLGYFELRPDGALTFQNTPPLPAAPRIEQIQVAGQVVTVSFATVLGYTYQLRSTSDLAASVPAWQTGDSVVGTGSILSLQATKTESHNFFALEVRP